MNRGVLVGCVVWSLLVSGCATAGRSGTPEDRLSGDGVLDCVGGQVVRSADTYVTGETESEVVEAALSDWAEAGADIIKLPDTEAWSAIIDGRDEAIAVPEVEGDGSWVVHDVQTCGDPDVGAAPIDGDLDCANDHRWIMQGSPSSLTAGAATAEEAMMLMLDLYRERHGGEIVLVDIGTGSLVVDDREQVVTTVSETPTGEWTVSSAKGCEGYEL